MSKYFEQNKFSYELSSYQAATTRQITWAWAFIPSEQKKKQTQTHKEEIALNRI